MTRKTSRNKAVNVMTGVGLAAFALSIAPAVAQTAEQGAAPADSGAAPAADTQKIVVTGSRLVNRGYEAPSPVSVVDATELKLSGAQTIETALVQSPQFLGNTYNAAGNGSSQGVSALNMRGLGEQRSLTLVNGRRYTVTGTSSLTDLNTIPSALVKRVEVVTGGSSAVYGSDAVSGVVNFIMRDDFKGVEATAETKRDAHTNTPANVATLTLGGNFDNDKGNAVVSLDYYNRGGILRSQFPWAAQGLADGCVTAASYSDHGAGVPLAVPSGQTCAGAGGKAGFVISNSSNVPAGRFAFSPLYGAAAATPGLNAALAAAGLTNVSTLGFTFDPNSNAARAYNGATDAFNNTPYNYMQTPLRRVMANSFAHYRFNDATTGYVETHFSNSLAQTAIAPGSITGNFLVNVNNPYVSAADQEVLRQLDLAETGRTTITKGTSTYTTTPGDGLAVLTLARRMAESSALVSTLERNTMRAVFGVRGDILDNLNYDLYYSYARTMTTENQTGNLSLSRAQNALLSANGAAPVLNLFGANTVTPANLQSLQVSSTNVTTNEQQVAAGNLTGSAFNLPAGQIDFNAGFEWRANKLALMPDAYNATGDVAGQGIILPVAGKTSVKELYAEVRVPVVKDLPFAKQLALNAAARYSDYSLGVGGVWTHSVGLQWQPVDDFNVRTQVQRAIRAPNIGELFSPRSPLTPVVNDPCSNRVAASTQTAALRALCAATGVPAANVFTAGVQPNAQIATLNGGNQNLKPETANTVTLGLIYTPHAIRNLGFTVDFYRIKLDGAIAPFGGNLQNVFDLCYNVFASASSVYCQAIHRDPVTGALTGNSYYVDQFLANTGGIKTSGVDLSAQYALNLPYSPFAGSSSRVDASTSWSYTREYTFTPVQDLPALKNYCVGSFGTICGAPAPKWKGVTRVTWRGGPLTLSLHDRYTGEVTRDTYVVPLRQGKTPPSLDSISAAKIKAQQYVDLSFSLALPAKTELYGGVNNLFDKDPPLLGSAAATWGLGTAPGVYELYGRSYFVGLKKQW